MAQASRSPTRPTTLPDLVSCLLALAVSICLSSPVVATVADPYERLREARFLGPVSLPPEGLVLRHDVATWYLDQGEIWLLEPLETGAVTGMVFEGSGRFELVVPDGLERRQLKRFTEDEEIEEVSVAVDRMVLRSALPEIEAVLRSMLEQVSGTSTGAGVGERIADAREEQWLRFEGHDAAARTLSAVRNLGSRYLRAAMRTERFDWLELDVDDLLPEEIRLMSREIRANFVSNRPWPVTETWVSLDRVEQREQGGQASGRANPALVLQHIEASLDLTELGKHPRQGLSGTHPLQSASKIRARFEARRDGLAALRLGLDPMAELEAVTGQGTDLSFLRYDVGEHDAQLDDRLHHRELVVFLDRPLQKGELVELEFEFDLELYGYAGGLHWYPIPIGTDYSHHTAAVEVRHRSDYHLAGMGEVERVEQGRYATTTFRLDDARLMTGFSWAKKAHERVYEEPGIPRVRMFGSTHGRMSRRRVEVPSRVVLESLRFFSEKFDRPLPADEVVVALTSASHGQAFGNYIQLPEWVVVDGAEFDSRDRAYNDRGRKDFFIAHEVAHLWWGHNTAWGTYRDYWLVEALAEYSAYLYVLEKHPDGQEVARRVLQAYTDELNGSIKSWFDTFARPGIALLNKGGADRLAPLSHGARAQLSETPSAASSILYRKGMLVLHMLRRLSQVETGSDDAFFELLQSYHDQAFGEDATNADFLAVASRELGMDLEVFGDQWIDSAEIPQLEFDSYLERADGGFELVVEARASSAPPGFESNVPVRVVFDDGSREEFLVAVLVGEPATVSRFFDRKPVEVLFNADFGVLAEMKRRARSAKNPEVRTHLSAASARP